uniref:Membrane protein insertion efficiency factor n=1 Tax=Oryza glumipatula TaxID=40148 RepID=A0A0E0BMG7_9ORYZ
MAASALLSPARPLAGTTLSFGVPYQNKRRIPTMRVYCAADEEEEVNDLGVNVALSMLKFYKREISPLLPSSCRYVPTCSQYSMQAYKKYGVAKGTILTAWRLCRCNPLGVRLYIRKDSIAYCLPMQLSQARVFRSSTAPDKGNLFVYSSIDSCHVEKLMALTRKNKQAMLQLEQSKGYIRHCRGNADSENWTCATHVEWAKRMRLFQP